MNYNMFSNKQNDQVDPNYIYPRPYIDPMMYMNPYMIYAGQFPGYQMEPTMNGYVTYTNPYADNPSNPDLSQIDNDSVYPTIEDNGYTDIETLANNMQNYPNMNIPNMQGIQPPIPNMMYPGMFPGMFPMSPNMMYPGMYPGMFPMPNMMYPGMYPGIPQINMEEFDEEEM